MMIMNIEHMDKKRIDQSALRLKKINHQLKLAQLYTGSSSPVVYDNLEDVREDLKNIAEQLESVSQSIEMNEWIKRVEEGD